MVDRGMCAIGHVSEPHLKENNTLKLNPQNQIPKTSAPETMIWFSEEFLSYLTIQKKG